MKPEEPEGASGAGAKHRGWKRLGRDKASFENATTDATPKPWLLTHRTRSRATAKASHPSVWAEPAASSPSSPEPHALGVCAGWHWL